MRNKFVKKKLHYINQLSACENESVASSSFLEGIEEIRSIFVCFPDKGIRDEQPKKIQHLTCQYYNFFLPSKFWTIYVKISSDPRIHKWHCPLDIFQVFGIKPQKFFFRIVIKKYPCFLDLLDQKQCLHRPRSQQHPFCLSIKPCASKFHFYQYFIP